MIANNLVGVQPLSSPTGKVYSIKHGVASWEIDYVKVLPAEILKYPNGSYVELYIIGASSDYPIFAKVNHEKLEYKFVNFSCLFGDIEGFHVLRSDVDIQRHIEEKPHWFI